jgi:hypothetical protein
MTTIFGEEINESMVSIFESEIEHSHLKSCAFNKVENMQQTFNCEDPIEGYISDCYQSRYDSHNFYDSVAIWKESIPTKVSNVAALGILPVCSFEYMLPMKFLLLMLYSLHIFLRSCKQENYFICQMFSWIHWKFDYT